MGIEEFVHCSSNASGQISSNIFQYVLGCVNDGVSDELSPAFVDNMCEKVSGEVSIFTDVDSFAYVSDDLPLRNSAGLAIRPLYSSSYMSDTGITWSHDVYTNNVSVGVHRIPNVQILKTEKLQVLHLLLRCRYLTNICRPVSFSLVFTRSLLQPKVLAHHIMYLATIMSNLLILFSFRLWV